MNAIVEQISSFSEKCDEMKNCKFIMATTKIKDLLKCIVNCPELYRLFETVTKDFDYPAFKATCLVCPDDGTLPLNKVVLPQTVGQRLAFIFCLLVEFDRGTLNFNDFLRQFYPEDGSYFASYQAFCNTVIKSLQDCVLQVFREQIEAEAEAESRFDESSAQTSEILSALGVAVAREMKFVTDSNIDADDKENGLRILSRLALALKEGDEELIDALLCGYNYFALHCRCASDGVAELIKLIEVYENNL